MSDATERLTFLRNLQEESGGAIPFGRWMSEALYHPQFGYYTTGIRTVGRDGDFSTWATLHESLGQAIAGWIKKNALPSKPRHIIEIGAGTGELAKAVLCHLPWWNRPYYHIVDVSPVLRAQQKKLLRGRSVRWHDSMAEAMAATRGRALIFSNELVDAFPCRIFQKQDGAWRELALHIEGGRIEERWQENPLPDSTIFEQPWPEGQRVEIQESFAHWLQDWVPAWREGQMLTIDYGDTAAAVYHRRPRGSLRAYSNHQRIEGVQAYVAFGRRDLTAEVNFSDLMRWGEKLGLPTVSLQTTGAFVQANGQPKANPPEGDLYVDGGAAEAFQALVQAR